jgi:RNA polymerase sigma factor (sigma-70 family)
MNDQLINARSAIDLAALYLDENTSDDMRKILAPKLFLPSALKELDAETRVDLLCHPATPQHGWVANVAVFAAEDLAVRYLEQDLEKEVQANCAKVLFIQDCLGQVADEYLAQLYSSAALKNQEAILEELLRRYYEPVDAEIRTVLHYRGWTYRDTDEYYNDIFFSIYKAVFERPHFDEHLWRFDSDRSSLEYYLLKVLVRRKAIDWLRKNEDRLYQRGLLIPREREGGEDESRPDLGSDGIATAAVDEASTEERERIRSAMDRLTPGSQVILHLRWIVYAFPPDDVIGYIAEEVASRTGEDEDLVRQRLKKELPALLDTLRASAKFAAEEAREEELALLQSKEHRYRFQVEDVRGMLEGEGESEADIRQAEYEAPSRKLGELAGEHKRLTLESRSNELKKRIKRIGEVEDERLCQALQKQIERMEKRLRRNGVNTSDLRAEADHQSVDDLYSHGVELQRALLINRFQEAIKRLIDVRSKRQRLMQERDEGKGAVGTPYKEIAKILQISEGAVGRRLYDAREELKKLLRDEDDEGDKNK